MKGLWGEGPFSFEGRHYQVAENEGVPKPASPIPVMIGGGGPKILSLAAQQADIVGINPKIVGRAINPRSMATTAADDDGREGGVGAGGRGRPRRRPRAAAPGLRHRGDGRAAERGGEARAGLRAAARR